MSLTTSPAAPVSSPDLRLSLAESNASCRGPVILLLGASSLWFILSAFLGLCASIKMHVPGFFSNCPYFTYGRLVPMQSHVFLYGFASQAGLGVGLWLLCRLARTTLAFPTFAAAGALFWNFGVLVGLVGICLGDASGYHRFDMPRYAAAVLFFSYLAIGCAGLATFHLRRERDLYPSVLYIMGALFWFPWLLATATILLQYGELRGAVQTVVSLWYGNGIFMLWLAPLSLAAIFYFLPKVGAQPLFSGGLAAFAFWLLALFGSLLGLNTHAALPSWFGALSSAASIILLVPAAALASDWHQTTQEIKGRRGSTFYYVRFAAVSFLVFVAMNLIFALPDANRVLLFSNYVNALSAAQLYPFCALALLGGMEFILPRVGLVESDSAAGPTLSYRLLSIGSAVIVLGLAAAGIKQGRGLEHASIPFVNAIKSSIPFIGIATLGWILFLAGAITFACSVRRSVCSCCCPPIFSRKDAR